MRIALALARRGLGNAWPNPAVGCVVVADGAIVGRGWTQPGGRPHAETEALGRAGGRARGATAYVTLEPCSHHGRTPPCSDALIAAGVRRVVAALDDPDPRVDGTGMAALRAAGIEVVSGVCAAEAGEVNAGFLSSVRRGRPLVTLKLATTLDGRIATRTGQSQWITGEPARAAAHLLRANHDAVLVGAGTARADDPELTCRLPGLAERSPVRVFLDGAEPMPKSHRLIAGAKRLRTVAVVPSGRKAYARTGVERLEVAADEAGRPGMAAALQALGGLGLTRLLVEGGAGIAAALLRDGLVDRLVWFRAPMAIGGDGLPAALGWGVDGLDSAPRFELLSVRRLGDDLIESYRKVE